MLPVTFNALAIEQPGSPVSLQQRTIASLKADEVLIRVNYASINMMDPRLAQRNVFNLPSPYVLGFDFSGEVARLGSAGGFELGDQVFGGSIVGGSFAEYVVAKKESLLLRRSVPAPEASTYGIAYMTAYESMVITGKVEQHKGQWIYIAGAAGGVGHFATQIAKLFGLKVIGSAGKAASLDLLRQLRVDHVVDYSKQDVVEEIMNLTGGKGVDLVFDSTYIQASYNQSAAVVASGGQYIRLGTQAQMAQFGLADVASVVEGRGAKMLIGDPGRYRVDPVYQAQAAKLIDGYKQAVAWYEKGKLKPVITQTIAFDAAALQWAFEGFLKGTINVGKVVVKCSQTT
jgi:NADPH:quinone reductase-like Zn-dependent oxidoreductase